MSSFFVIRGKDNGQHFPVRGAVAYIGRGGTCLIRVNDTEVSRQHAMVLRTEAGEYEIVDNSSSNGTHVNSRRVSRQLLQSGDRVQVGRTLMIYTGGPESPSPKAPSGDKADSKLRSETVEFVSGAEARDISRITRSLLSEPSVRSTSGIIGGSQPPDNDSSAALLPGQPIDSDTNSQPSDWEIVYQVSQAIHRTVDLDELLNQVLKLIFEWIGCHRGCILMFDEVTGHLTPSCSHDRKISSRGDQNRSSSPKPIRISQTILDHVLSTREGVLTSNAQDDSRWQGVESIASIGVHEAICVPMLGRYGLVGAIYVDTTVSAGVFAERNQQSSFDGQHLKLLLATACQAALAIEDTQFYHAVLQSEKLAAMGHTIANLSHHVKNILQGVKGGSYLVEDGIKKEDLSVIDRGWSIVSRNQDRISNLVMDMLSFSKDREPDLQTGDVGKLLAEVIELMQARALELDARLDYTPPESPVMAEFDSEGLHRAVLNVVTNALDAVSELDDPSRRVVEVSAACLRAKELVRVVVSDCGEGIPDAQQAKIFAPFESSKGSRGTGLGLPVSRKTLREHGGDILVETEMGVGSKFILQWPIQQSATSPTKTVETP